MEAMSGKTAVITGGASGMGKAFASRLGAAGMKIVIADIEEPAIDATIAELQGAGVEAVGVRTDVSELDSMMSLAADAKEAFGSIDVVALNAGVGGGNGRLETLTTNDWEWTFGVNLYGIVHGLQAFLPDLKAADSGHVVMTASVAGHLAYPSMGPYNATKFATVALAETLKAELTHDGSNVGVTCLCPGLVLTGIFQSERNRPEQLLDTTIATEPVDDETAARREAMADIVLTHGKSAAMVADLVHDAIRDDTFWVFTDEDFDQALTDRHAAIRERRPTTATQSLLGVYDE